MVATRNRGDVERESAHGSTREEQHEDSASPLLSNGPTHSWRRIGFSRPLSKSMRHAGRPSCSIGQGDRVVWARATDPRIVGTYVGTNKGRRNESVGPQMRRINDKCAVAGDSFRADPPHVWSPTSLTNLGANFP